MNNQSNNICFISGSIEEANLLFGIGNYLKKNFNIKFFFVFTRKYIYDYFYKQNKNNIFYFNWKINFLDNNEIYKYLEKYKEINLSLAKLSDPILINKNFDYSIKIIIKHLNLWEKFIYEKSIKAIIHYPTASVVGRTSYFVCKKKKIKHLIIQTGPLIDKTFTLCDINENWIWKNFLNIYFNKNYYITKEQKTLVNNIINEILNIKNRSLKIKKINLKNIISIIYKSIKYKKFDLIELNEYKKVIIPFFRKYLMMFFHYDKINNKDKFVFFPLHILWDAQIATRNPMFSDQLYLIKILSNSLPYGYKLYVKEHPYNYAGEKIKFLNKIKKIENVKLIHPEISSISLIKKSSAVVTINSTAGFEAIILKKPLITFGRTFYSYFKYTYKIDYLNDLPELIQKVLFSDWNKIINKKYFLDEWHKFLFAVYKTSKKGAANSYKNYMGLGINMFDNNLKEIALSIKENL